MTTMLDRPSFKAGISPKSGVMQDSSHESAMARENSIPVSVISLTREFRNTSLPFLCSSLRVYGKRTAFVKAIKNLQGLQDFPLQFRRKRVEKATKIVYPNKVFRVFDGKG